MTAPRLAAFVPAAALLAALGACRPAPAPAAAAPAPAAAAPAPRAVRAAETAGRFYPGDPAELAATVKALLAAAPRTLEGGARIVLAPHAGLPYSGAIAAAAFRQLDPGFDRAVVVAANHYGPPFQGWAVDRATHYAVPGREVPVAAAARALAGAADVPGAHRGQMIEIELPFLAEANGGRPFELVPVIAGALSYDDARRLAGALAALDAPGTVFVFSVDLSHYHPYDVASSRDRACLDAVVRMDARDLVACDTDGTQVLAAMVELAARRGTTPRLVAYANSGDVSADRTRVVGYAAVAFEERLVLTTDERAALLALARASLDRAVKEGSPAAVPADVAGRFPRLRADRGSFVTLKLGGRLRGCIGSVEAREPLADGVARNALLAALRDPRFPPVSARELPAIRLSVSVLDAPRALAASGPALLATLGAERPGVILEHEGRTSTFLPAVWKELKDPAQFLAALCEKQGSPATCWASPAARFRTYAAIELDDGR
ncbi:MAG TPA: AmmeMemoRadiSam system protein B [Anaeromyxobacter sp.]|nr:AmmeMemoRadiSam system protein B [Anaeromyxobacter sp.]